MRDLQPRHCPRQPPTGQRRPDRHGPPRLGPRHLVRTGARRLRRLVWRRGNRSV